MSRIAQAVRDAALSAQVGAAALTSWTLPESLWLPLTHAIGRVLAGSHAAPGASGPSLDEALGAALGCAPRSIAIERIASGHASRLWGLREYRRPRKDQPIDVDGVEHVAAALSRGRGAILWVGRFTWASIITKIGLHDAGCVVTHLSRPTHGFGTSPFAMRSLNPVWTRIEERFVRERVVMEPGAERTALRALRRRLEENGVVSITVGDEGARAVTVPFLGWTLRLASGPASLAAASGAPLLPVFTVREATGRFRVGIEPAIDVAPDDDRDVREGAVARCYAERLEPWVRQYPGQWLG